ncbi:MAG: NTP transferase domain-containing protein [Parvularculaceae bacterium]
MDQRALAAIILAAGHGTRMKSSTPKVLHEIGGRSMLAHIMSTAAALSPQRMAVVIGDHAPGVGDAARKARADVAVCVQSPPRGTGDAAKKAMVALEGFKGVTLVLYADTPLVEAQTLAALADEVRNGATIAVLGFTPCDPAHYGRLKLGADGSLEAIVEAKDASPEELEIDLVNSGVMAIDSGFLAGALPQLSDENAKREFYLTDIVAIARRQGLGCSVIEADEDEVVGVNSRAELAVAEGIFQDRRRLEALEAGVTLIDPSSVYFSFDTTIAEDVVIEPNVYFGKGVTIATGARIKANSHLEGAQVGEGASVGPFARLRPGARLGASAKVGNFVEIKNADLGVDAKVSHLTYIGDAEIGAGRISARYDYLQLRRIFET